MAFESFQLSRIDTGEATLRVRHGGSGPPLLLLHGYPETHMMWGKIADDLARDFGVTVLYMTANPGMLGDGVAGTVGVLSKPADERAVQSAVDYALRRRQGRPAAYAPPELRLFG